MITDEELLQQSAGMPTVYVDGFGAFRKINGVLRAVGYVIGQGAQLNLIISLTGAESGNAEVRRLLDEKPHKNIVLSEVLRMAH